ncbi:MAG: 23S rRNA (pseudouridine(1915)-N(3))-methyltransferase RlmH [Bacteroidetes bacterium]|nr:23S rRNA (pseudouridine(1915)-N(3))-methyltransferase RlmH [Bacteroidota bacterium]
MKITLFLIGKTEEGFVKTACEQYEKRLKHYIPFVINVIPDVKNAGKLAHQELKLKEGELLLKQLNNSDFVVLLDDKGKQFSSIEYAAYLQLQMNSGLKNLCFVVGGAFGFSDEVYARANSKFSLSKMTFTHQMIRMLFLEQSYRALSILKGESYHHE